MDTALTREQIENHIRRLLVGPFDPREVLPSAPSDTYLTGVLWPKHSELEASNDDAGQLERVGAEQETAEAAIPGYRAIRPCSIGLTCSVSAGASIVIDLHGTARYVEREAASPDREETSPALLTAAQPEPSGVGDKAKEAEPGPGGRRNRTEWIRDPLDYRVVLDPNEQRTAWRTNRFLLPDGTEVEDLRVGVHIKRRAEGGVLVLTVTLINDAPAPPRGTHRDSACLFQSTIAVEAKDRDGSGAIRPRPAVMHADDEDARSNLLLFRSVHEFAVGHGVAVEWEGTGATVSCVRASWLPRASVKATSAKGHRSLDLLAGKRPRIFEAEWLGRIEGRSEVCDALDELVAAYRNWIKSELSDVPPGAGAEAARAAEENRDRCIRTAERIAAGVRTLRSSSPAWEAFVLANRAMDMQARFPAKKDRAGPLVWRPFQLAFLLLVIPSIVDPVREKESRDCMDLLWFPTGGGKTEAYLALVAFQIVLRRLEDRGRRTDDGVDVLMRYTLRLLTIQQFQRAAALIVACDMLREADPRKLGDAPISLGLYVGGDSTPNSFEDARRRLDEERNNLKPSSTPRQLLKCPVCGTDLGTSNYRIPQSYVRIDIVCSNGQCATQGRPLPVMTVDELIYAKPPSLVIGTVDKFAQLPRREDIRRLFGLDAGLRPGLIIQDELHLISGPLGSMTGLYESAIDLLCTADGVRPKIIGSTATIGRAGRQVLALFDRDVLQFPPPGFDASDSFFAVRDEEAADRIYLGVSTAGRSPKFALQAVLAALLQSVHTLREKKQAPDTQIDPYWTCVAYFNSLRELGGAHVLMLDDVPRQMQFLAGRLQASARVTEGPPRELSSRVSSRDIPSILHQMEQSLGAEDVFAAEPLYAVLASNMISVGVDVPRLGLMVVNGQPKSTAEYIQASSRVGRQFHGLVVTLYNFGRPRDVSHFEHFLAYHGALYRGVEATSVTPWAPRARDKALHAAFIALVRHLVSGMAADENAIDFDANRPEVQRIVQTLISRAARGSHGLEDADAARDLREVLRKWTARAVEARATQTRLRYWERRAPFGNALPHLMRAAEEAGRGHSAAWPTPNSMREIEPSTAFVLRRIGRKGGQKGGDEETRESGAQTRPAAG